MKVNRKKPRPTRSNQSTLAAESNVPRARTPREQGGGGGGATAAGFAHPPPGQITTPADSR